MKRPKSPIRKTKASDKEIEVKLPVADCTAMRRRLLRLGAKQQGVRVHEMNTLYDTPRSTLRASGRMLRIRVERPVREAGVPSITLTYKGPVQSSAYRNSSQARSYKVREERETVVTAGDAIVGIIEGIGLYPSFQYEKYRSTFRLPSVPGVIVELDETPIGDFLELEGDREAIDRAAGLLGFGPADYNTKSYGALYLEYASKRVPGKRKSISSRSRDMVFRQKQKRK